MPRADEQIILFPALARPAGDGAWKASLRGVVFRPCEGSIRLKLLVRAIARGAGVGRKPLLIERLRRGLAPFLVDNCSRRRITVEVAGQRVQLGPSGRNGHLRGEVEFASDDEAGVIEYRLCGIAGSGPEKAAIGLVHLLPRRGLSVVSDIDDTIKHSCVPDSRELLRNTFLRPSRCVVPVRTALRRLAADGAAVHYVSASPWQLYPALRAFMRRAGLPDGSFHLKDFRAKDRTALALLAPPERFKTPVIEGLMDTWPERRFVLVGDSSERDPEIYGGLARERPSQVAAVVIRSIPGPRRFDGRRLRGAPPEIVHVLEDVADWQAVAAAIGEDA